MISGGSRSVIAKRWLLELAIFFAYKKQTASSQVQRSEWDFELRSTESDYLLGVKMNVSLSF